MTIAETPPDAYGKITIIGAVPANPDHYHPKPHVDGHGRIKIVDSSQLSQGPVDVTQSEPTDGIRKNGGKSGVELVRQSKFPTSADIVMIVGAIEPDDFLDEATRETSSSRQEELREVLLAPSSEQTTEYEQPDLPFPSSTEAEALLPPPTHSEMLELAIGTRALVQPERIRREEVENIDTDLSSILKRLKKADHDISCDRDDRIGGIFDELIRAAAQPFTETESRDIVVLELLRLGHADSNPVTHSAEGLNEPRTLSTAIQVANSGVSFPIAQELLEAMEQLLPSSTVELLSRETSPPVIKRLVQSGYESAFNWGLTHLNRRQLLIEHARKNQLGRFVGKLVTLLRSDETVSLDTAE